MVDSEHQWMLAEQAFFRSILSRWSASDNHKVVGVIVEDIYAMLVRDHGLKMDKAEFMGRCHRMADDIYRRRVSLTPRLRDFIRGLKSHATPLGLASSSPASWVDIVLKRFRLRRHFAAVITGDDAPGRTKPAPDLYLLAARRLGVRPSRCLAVEDSSIGVRAAKAAGMTCVGLRSGRNAEQDLCEADWEARGFAELGYRRLISRLKTACALTKAPQSASKA